MIAELEDIDACRKAANDGIRVGSAGEHMHDVNDVERGGSRRVLFAFGIVGFVISAALILAGARGELWFDELMSLSVAERAQGPWDIVTKHRFDNNHVLNTVYLYALGPQWNSAYLYRALALFSGIVSLGLITWVAGRKGPMEGLSALVLAGTSYPLIHYWSEARGFAPAMLCSLLAFVSLQSTWRRLTFLNVVGFWISLILGILAHLTFVIVAFAFLVAMVARQVRSRAGWQRGLGSLAVLWFVPLGFWVLFYLNFVKELRIIGGPVIPYGRVLGTAVAMLLGTPDDGWLRALAGIAYLGVVLAGVVFVLRCEPEEWSFFLAALLVGPLGLLALARPDHLYFRYFVVTFPFFYILLAYLVGALCRWAGRWGSATAVLLLFPWILGHGQRIDELLTHGRGNNRAALRYVSSRAPKGELRIGCDNQTALSLSFYARELPQDQTLRIFRLSQREEEKPEWLITRNQNPVYRPPDEMVFSEQDRYRLAGEFLYGGVSGWNSFLWQRAVDTEPETDSPPSSSGQG